jgi:hypothetical protein
MAAVFALAVSPGPYGWLSTGAGIVLLLLLTGYYRPMYLAADRTYRCCGSRRRLWWYCGAADEHDVIVANSNRSRNVWLQGR